MPPIVVSGLVVKGHGGVVGIVDVLGFDVGIK